MVVNPPRFGISGAKVAVGVRVEPPPNWVSYSEFVVTPPDSASQARTVVRPSTFV